MRLNYYPLRDPAAAAGGGGATAPALDLNVLPEDIRGHASLANIKTIPDLAKSYVHAQQMIGAKRIAIPANDAAPAAWDEFYAAIGRPDSLDKYELPKIDGIDPSLVPDEAKLKAVRELFHKQGLTQKQANAVMEYYMRTTDGALKQHRTTTEAATAQAVASLKQEWGANFDSNLDIAKSVIKKFGDEQFMSYLDQSQMGSNAALIKMLHKMGVAMLEDTSRGGAAGGDLNLTDQSRAATEIERLKTDTEFQKALHDARHPGHKAAVNRWTNLFAAAHPNVQE